MEFDKRFEGGEFGACRNHPSGRKPPQGVCPACLIDRLSRLCPVCAQYRPCDCLFCYPSSFSSSSSAPIPPFSQLSDNEPPTTVFRHSLSSALCFIRPCSSRKPGSVVRPAEKEKDSHKWKPFWSFWPKWDKKKEKEDGVMQENKRTEEEMLLRSKSGGVGSYSDVTSAEASGGVKKGRAWHLPGPICKALRRRKRTARVAHQQSHHC